MNPENEEREILERAANFSGLSDRLSRRQFLFASGIMVMAASIHEVCGATESPLIIVDQANGLVIGDPTKCVGCRRCELACSEFNDGKASPTIARIKVSRNLNFGSHGVHIGRRGQGSWGNGLVIQDLCKQCPHPVPCANACPNDAIVLYPPTNARVVDSNRCIGCKMCLGACPWEMISFDSDTNKATKCFLCDGHPKCVEACPAEALSYVPWHDLTHKTQPRIAPTAVVSPDKAQTCNDCHKQ